MRGSDLRTKAIVLHRTKYGETDRILNLITPEGRKSCIARGARKEKSKLAGGIEMFTVSDIVIHKSEKSELGILTSAKMLRSYLNIISDLDRFNLGSRIIKDINRVSENVDSPELFTLTDQSFWALDKNIALNLVDAYFTLNLVRISGEQINLISDQKGDKLDENQKYNWDMYEKVLIPSESGSLTSSHIKLLRLILASPIKTITGVQNIQKFLPDLIPVVRTFSQN